MFCVNLFKIGAVVLTLMNKYGHIEIVIEKIFYFRVHRPTSKKIFMQKTQNGFFFNTIRRIMYTLSELYMCESEHRQR